VAPATTIKARAAPPATSARDRRAGAALVGASACEGTSVIADCNANENSAAVV
jgi:hypothetical protein